MITKEQFLLRQPSAPEITQTDEYFYNLCKELIEVAKEENLFPSYPEGAIDRAALCIIGYYQDIICDAGVWRSFITANRILYGWTVPFEEIGKEYIDFELNRADVRFMVWYSLSMNYEPLRIMYPLTEELINGADRWFEILEGRYDDSPIPVDYRLVHELEMQAHEDREAIMKLGRWLFMHCYLMTPAFSLTLRNLSAGCNLETEEGVFQLREKLEEAISGMPTGPLSLFLGEWLYLIIEGRLPKEKTEEKHEEHKYYKPFIEATGGKRIAIFDNYEKMNEFFIEALGWAKGEEHLSQQAKGAENYVLMVDKRRGMLMARNVAKNIAAPFNPLYDKEYARVHAILMLTVRGYCPADLTKYLFEEGWLPDASFPGSNDSLIVKTHYDFIMRCYLQDYYRD